MYRTKKNPMRRFHLIELHEQPWFPSFLRDEITGALQFGLSRANAYAPIAAMLERAVDSSRSQAIVDLCSGAGGPWLNLARCRTMFTSSHHFAPDEARAILQDAVDARQSIGIFEVTRRAPSAIGFMLLWSIFLFICTPWIRPFRWSRIFCTYVIPIIPAVLLFDGVVSCLRTYRPPELRAIAEKLNASDYTWDSGVYYGTRQRMPITYLIGFPTTPVASAVAAA